MTEARVIIDASVEQAQALSKLLDLATRIHLGQFGEIEMVAREQELLVRADATSSKGRPATADELEDAEALLIRLKGIFGHHANGSYGIGAEGVSILAKRGYEMKKTIDKALHGHLTPDLRHVVTSSGVTARYTPDALPTVRVETKS